MEKLIIEVGSTCTKVDLFDGKEINRIKTETIEFKRNSPCKIFKLTFYAMQLHIDIQTK